MNSVKVSEPFQSFRASVGDAKYYLHLQHHRQHHLQHHLHLHLHLDTYLHGCEGGGPGEVEPQLLGVHQRALLVAQG
jgi:hypothetical protein